MANYDQEIYNTAILEGFNPTVAKLIVAQARYESNNYGSNVFKCNNNMYGMKYVGQSLATRGTLAPANEVSIGCTPTGSGCNRNGTGNCKDRDFYAKYNSPADSAKDVITRLYKISRSGVGFNELNSATDATSFATLLKKRSYYGFATYGSHAAESEIRNYAGGLRTRLLLVNVLDFYQKNEKAVNLTIVGLVLIGISGYFYYLSKRKII